MKIHPYLFAGLDIKPFVKLTNQVNILKKISHNTKIAIQDIKSNNRKKEFVYCRWLFCAIANQLGGSNKLTLEKIGESINKDHSTVIYSIKQSKNKYNYEFIDFVKKNGFENILY